MGSGCGQPILLARGQGLLCWCVPAWMCLLSHHQWQQAAGHAMLITTLTHLLASVGLPGCCDMRRVLVEVYGPRTSSSSGSTGQQQQQVAATLDSWKAGITTSRRTKTVRQKWQELLLSVAGELVRLLALDAGGKRDIQPQPLLLRRTHAHMHTPICGKQHTQ